MKNTYNLEFGGYWLHSDRGVVPNKRGIYCVYSCEYMSEYGSVLLKKLLYVGAAENVRAEILEKLEQGAWRHELGLDEQLCYTYGEEIERKDGISLTEYQQIRNLLEYSSKLENCSSNVDLSSIKNLVVRTRGANRLLKNGDIKPKINENVIQFEDCDVNSGEERIESVN